MMNEVEKNKTIIHTSWLYEAINTQFRTITNDIKRCLMFSQFKLSIKFNSFSKNIKISEVLINQSYRNFNSIVKNSSFNEKNVQNVYNLYVKRGLYQEKVACEFLNNLKYDIHFANDNEFKTILAKTYNLHSLLIQLEQNYFKLQYIS